MEIGGQRDKEKEFLSVFSSLLIRACEFSFQQKAIYLRHQQKSA